MRRRHQLPHRPSGISHPQGPAEGPGLGARLRLPALCLPLGAHRRSALPGRGAVRLHPPGTHAPTRFCKKRGGPHAPCRLSQIRLLRRVCGCPALCPAAGPGRRPATASSHVQRPVGLCSPTGGGRPCLRAPSRRKRSPSSASKRTAPSCWPPTRPAGRRPSGACRTCSPIFKQTHPNSPKPLLPLASLVKGRCRRSRRWDSPSVHQTSAFTQRGSFRASLLCLLFRGCAPASFLPRSAPASAAFPSPAA